MNLFSHRIRRPAFPSINAAAATLLAFSTLTTPIDAFLHTNNKNIVDTDGKVVLLKGFSPGEWMNIESYMLGNNFPGPDVGTVAKPTWGHTAIRTKLTQLMGQANADEFYKRWTANIITEADVAQYAGWGVNSLRISMNYHWLSSADGVYIEDGFKMLDSIVAWGARYHVYMILCMHAAPGGQSNEQMADVADGNARLWTDSATYQPWCFHLWQKVAQRYADEPWVGGYDLFDEPIPFDKDNGENPVLVPLVKRLTAAIRTVDKNHMLFVESADNWSGVFTGMAPAWDDNMAWSFHDYEDKATTITDFTEYLNLRTSSGAPIWNGEFGENANSWATATSTKCNTNNIGWSWWTIKKVADNTQPYTIATPANFSKIVSAFSSNASISAADATTIMLQLADNAATAKCTFNSALVKALGFCPTCPPAKPATTGLNGLRQAPVGRVPFSLRAVAGPESMRVSFVLPKADEVHVVLCDTKGNVKEHSANVTPGAGSQSVVVGAAGLAKGVYYCGLYAGGKKVDEVAVVVDR